MCMELHYIIMYSCPVHLNTADIYACYLTCRSFLLCTPETSVVEHCAHVSIHIVCTALFQEYTKLCGFNIRECLSTCKRQ